MLRMPPPQRRPQTNPPYQRPPQAFLPLYPFASVPTPSSEEPPDFPDGEDPNVKAETQLGIDSAAGSPGTTLLPVAASGATIKDESPEDKLKREQKQTDDVLTTAVPNVPHEGSLTIPARAEIPGELPVLAAPLQSLPDTSTIPASHEQGNERILDDPMLGEREGLSRPEAPSDAAADLAEGSAKRTKL
jgi:hypothetical protein